MGSYGNERGGGAIFLMIMMRRTVQNLFHIHVIVSFINNEIRDLRRTQSWFSFLLLKLLLLLLLLLLFFILSLLLLLVLLLHWFILLLLLLLLFYCYCYWYCNCYCYCIGSFWSQLLSSSPMYWHKSSSFSS